MWPATAAWWAAPSDGKRLQRRQTRQPSEVGWVPGLRLLRVKTTSYFDLTRTRPDRVFILDSWIAQTVQYPLHEVLQADGRIRRWALIAAYDNRALRVVLLQDGITVHNAFFDRRFVS